MCSQINKMASTVWWFLLCVLLLLSCTYKADESLDGEEEATIETVPDDADDLNGMRIQFAEDGVNLPNIFKPTKEWQRVKPGQPIPRGLHVRHDLQTGLTEAKLLEEEEPTTTSLTAVESDTLGEEQVETDHAKQQPSHDINDVRSDHGRGQGMAAVLKQAVHELEKDDHPEDPVQYWKDGEREGMLNLQGDTFTPAELKEALKKFKANQDDVQNSEEVLKMHDKFRSYSELKEELSDMNVEMKSETEIIQELIHLYSNPDLPTEQQVSTLTDLEYYVHQIDNAQNFVEMGGLTLLIGGLNSTDASVRAEAALTLGSATQSNPAVQSAVVESGVLFVLTRLLVTETSPDVLSRTLYATSAALRHSSIAQDKFFANAGLHALSLLLHRSGLDKIKIKVITLLTDLIHESTSIPSTDANISSFHHLKAHIQEHGLCVHLPQLLDTTDYDTKEKVIHGLLALKDICRTELRQPEFINKLKLVESEYIHLSKTDEDGYFIEVSDILQNLITDLASHDEL